MNVSLPPTHRPVETCAECHRPWPCPAEQSLVAAREAARKARQAGLDAAAVLTQVVDVPPTSSVGEKEKLMNRNELREFDRASRSVGARIAGWTVVAVLFFGVLGGGIWAFKVATSEVKGQGDKTRIVNDGKNQIAAQETFEALFQQIQAYDRNLDQAAKDKAEHPGDAFFATNYSGLVKTCNDAVAQYNADANKVSRAKWRSDALPFQIDITNPLTDCKETPR